MSSDPLAVETPFALLGVAANFRAVVGEDPVARVAKETLAVDALLGALAAGRPIVRVPLVIVPGYRQQAHSRLRVDIVLPALHEILRARLRALAWADDLEYLLTAGRDAVDLLVGQFGVGVHSCALCSSGRDGGVARAASSESAVRRMREEHARAPA